MGSDPLALYGLALLDVGEEVFGGLAPVADVCAEQAVPVLEHVEEVVLGDGLLFEKVEEGRLVPEPFAALGDELLLLGRVRKVVEIGEICLFNTETQRHRGTEASFTDFSVSLCLCVKNPNMSFMSFGQGVDGARSQS